MQILGLSSSLRKNEVRLDPIINHEEESKKNPSWGRAVGIGSIRMELGY
jgi:hypothetical protein